MAGFLLYFPGWQMPSMPIDKIPRECNLGPLLGESPGMLAGPGRGPDGGHGLLAAIKPATGSGGEAAVIDCQPTGQKWLQCKTPDGKATTHWLGWWLDKAPRPKDLQREHLHAGYPMLMGGHEWQVPVVHAPYTSLSEGVDVDECGNVLFPVAPKYESIVAESAEWWGRHFGGEPSTGHADAVGYAARVLGINYRVDPRVLSVRCLGAFDNLETVARLIWYSIGGAEMSREADAKKKGDTAPLGGVVSLGVVG